MNYDFGGSPNGAKAGSHYVDETFKDELYKVFFGVLTSSRDADKLIKTANKAKAYLDPQDIKDALRNAFADYGYKERAPYLAGMVLAPTEATTIEMKKILKRKPKKTRRIKSAEPKPVVPAKAAEPVYEKPISEYPKPEEMKEKLRGIVEKRGNLIPFEDNLDSLLTGLGTTRKRAIDMAFDLMCAGLLYETDNGHAYPAKDIETLKFALKNERIPVGSIASWCGESDIEKLHKLLEELHIEVDVVSRDAGYVKCVELGYVSEILEKYNVSFL